MPYEVKATPVALAYRLTGHEPLPRLCVHHLGAKDRVIVAFESATSWVLLVGPHDEKDRRTDIDTSLYQLAGVDLPETPRTKPPC